VATSRRSIEPWHASSQCGAVYCFPANGSQGKREPKPVFLDPVSGFTFFFNFFHVELTVVHAAILVQQLLVCFRPVAMLIDFLLHNSPLLKELHSVNVLLVLDKVNEHECTICFVVECLIGYMFCHVLYFSSTHTNNRKALELS
jgi:hypothetical protein